MQPQHHRTSDSDRVPPHNLEAEESTLGSMILNSEALATASEMLRPDDFYRDQHRVLFKELCELGREGLPGDLVLVADRLNEKGLLDSVGGKAYIHTLVDTTPNSHNIKHYCEIVRDCANNRRAIDNAYLIIAAAQVGEPYEDYLNVLGECHNVESDDENDFITAADLAEIDFPPIRWILEPILPAGLTILAGPPKIGKSWLALQIALAAASGGKALGYNACYSQVLYIALEDGQRRLQSRINTLLQGQSSPPDSLTLTTSWKPLDEGGPEDLDRYLAKQSDVGLVVIDTIGRIRGQVRNRQSSYQDDVQTYAPLHKLTIAHDVCILCITHTRKMGDPIDHFNTISGTTGTTGTVDTSWVLERPRCRCDAALRVTGRDLPEDAFAVEFDGTSGLWTVSGPLEEYQLSEERAGIVELLREADAPMRPSEIAKAVGKDEAGTRVTLRRLLDKGVLTQPGRGLYEVKTADVIPVDFGGDKS